MARTPLIEVRYVAKTFARGDEEVRVLDHLSTEIGRGEYVALMGPSGSGKTTLLNLLGALDRPDSGAILVAGEDITTCGDDELASGRARAVVFIFQADNLLPVLKAV